MQFKTLAPFFSLERSHRGSADKEEDDLQRIVQLSGRSGTPVDPEVFHRGASEPDLQNSVFGLFRGGAGVLRVVLEGSVEQLLKGERRVLHQLEPK